MALTGAERARLYRQRKKESEAGYTSYLQKERERYHKRKAKGDIKLIADMTEREKRSTRKNWKFRKQNERNKKKLTDLHIDTPPHSPGPFPIQMNIRQGRLRVRRDRAKAYRDIAKLKQTVDTQRRIIERYKKRIYRQKQKSKDLNSPMTKTNVMLEGQRVSSPVKRTLLFHHVLVQGIKEKYLQTKSERSKQLLSKTLCSKLLKKYRMKKTARHHINLTQRRVNESNCGEVTFSRKARQPGLMQILKSSIESFLCREDNARVKAGKKSTKTKAKIKKQVYLMNDTLKNLHLKYLAEDATRKISYSLFCKLKPFYIRHATSADRETCLCKRHENLQFKVNKLKQTKLIKSNELDALTAMITCRNDSLGCMYRTCELCSMKKVDIGQFDPGQMVEWYEWKTKRVEKIKSTETSDQTRVISITVKDCEKGTLQQLVDEFQEELSKCCRHLYNIHHQYKAIRQLKEKLSDTDVLLHIDFSENYSCKYRAEIQSMHFGASQRQVSLHTGIIYTDSRHIPFCSLSDNLKHSPSGIWGHIKPILQFVKKENPSVTNLLVLSDGPTTQYRCKENFHLLTKVPLEIGYRTVNWNFTEAGHGKGAPDGIGAVIKRAADRAVAHGNDVLDAKGLHDILTGAEIAVKLFLIDDEEIDQYESYIKSQNLKTIQGTMKMHQQDNSYSYCAIFNPNDGGRTAFYQIVDRSGARPLEEIIPRLQSEACFPINANMTPEFEFIAYFINTYLPDGDSKLKEEVLVSTTVVKAPYQPNSQVVIQTTPDSVEPGGNVTIRVTAPEMGLFGVRAVDKSSFLLSPPHDISDAKINALISKDLLFNNGDQDVSGSMGPMGDIMPIGRFPMPDQGVTPGTLIRDAGMMVAVSGVLLFNDAPVYEYTPSWGNAYYYDDYVVADDIAGAAPDMMPDQGEAEDADTFSKQQSTAGKVETKKSNQVRTKFPETWLWYLGETNMSSELAAPHTLTTWVIDAFYIGPTIGLVAMPTQELKVTKDLFVTFDLPYSVVRGEKFNLKIFVFNNLLETATVRVTLEDSDNGYFEFTDPSERTATLTVQGGSMEAFVVPIKPLVIGNHELIARAEDLVRSSNTDELHRVLKIEAEGREIRNTTQFTFEFRNDGDTTRSFNVRDLVQVNDYVNNSLRAYAKVSGGIMGAYLEGLGNGDRIKMPHGCGEQNLMTMVPAVFVGKYLKSANDLDFGNREKVVKACTSGYNRELLYVHPDGSFSAFGPNGGAKGSTWLTAYVLNVFAKIGEEGFTSSLDVRDLHKAFTFLKSKMTKNSDSAELFNEDGVVIHQEMLGGVTGDANVLSFSAFIVICIQDYYDFLNSTGGNAQWKTEVELSLRGAMQWLDEKIVTTNTSPYTKAMVAYALAKFQRLVDNTNYALTASRIMSEFTLGATEKATPIDETWYGYLRPTSTDVERHGYALLAYIALAKEYPTLVVKARQITDWLVNQRGEDGFFITTQDTSVALQALAEFSIAFPAQSSVNFDISFNGEAVRIRNDNYKYGFTSAIPLGDEHGDIVKMYMNGVSGKAYVTIVAIFNRMNGKEVSPLYVYVDKYETPERQPYLKVVVKAVPRSEENISAMVVSVMKMPSGFKATDVVADDNASQPDRIEFSEDDTVVSCYFMNNDGDFAKERTTKVFYEQVYQVDDLQPGRIEVMDYYNPDNNRIAMVNALTSDPGPTTGASSVTISLVLLSITTVFLLVINGVY